MKKLEYTPSPWVAYEEKIDEKNKHTLIFTDWIHGQLKAPAPIMSLSYPCSKEYKTTIYLEDYNAILMAASPEMYELLYELATKNPEYKTEELEKIRGLLDKIYTTKVTSYEDKKKNEPKPYFYKAQVGDRVFDLEAMKFGTLSEVYDDSWILRIRGKHDGCPDASYGSHGSGFFCSLIDGCFHKGEKQFLFYATKELEKERGV